MLFPWCLLRFSQRVVCTIYCEFGALSDFHLVNAFEFCCNSSFDKKIGLKEKEVNLRIFHNLPNFLFPFASFLYLTSFILKFVVFSFLFSTTSFFDWGLGIFSFSFPFFIFFLGIFVLETILMSGKILRTRI